MEHETHLVKTEAARRAIEEARSVDEVKSIRDQAEAARTYAKQAKLGTEMVNAAAEIKLRAERRAGQILSEMDKHPAGRPAVNPSSRSRDLPPKLADIGVTYDQSSRWQQMAQMPQNKFEQALAESKAAGEEITLKSVLRMIEETAEVGDVPDDAPKQQAVHVHAHHRHVCKDCGVIWED